MQQSEEKRQDWTATLNNKKLSKKEKFVKIKEKARELEEMALRKEQILNVKGNFDNLSKTHLPTSSRMVGNSRDERNIEDTMEVNEMLVDAIKAKLAILDNIN